MFSWSNAAEFPLAVKGKSNSLIHFDANANRPEIRAAVGGFIKRNPPPRVAAAAPTPAMPGMMPPAAMQPAPAANPVFGGGGLLPGGGQ